MSNSIDGRRWVARCGVVVSVLALLCTAVSLGGEKTEPAAFAWRSGAKLKQDFKRFYSRKRIPPLLIGIGTAYVLANTSADEDFQTWYQDSVRSGTTDNVSDVAKVFGEGSVVIPVALGAYLSARIGNKPNSHFGHWGERTLRGLIVGAPSLLFLENAIGSSRPSDNRGSDWRPFEDSAGVSDHAFTAAVPLLAAARMSHKKSVKGVLYFASTLTAWSRINDNEHFFSQAALGWWIGYLATAAVDRTERDPRVRVNPQAVAGGVAVTVTIRL